MKKLLMLSLLLSTTVFAEVWDADNDPRNFDKNYEYKLAALPLKASLPLSKTPWSSSYWPRMKGGINYRWNTPNPIGNDLNSPSRLRVRSMSWQQLSELSPAEKFDLAQGHYDYPLSTRVEKQYKKNAKDYEGLCDGWAVSAIQFPEPAPVDVTNPEGIVIPFGSSDIKALMSYDISINFKPGVMKSVFIGSYCGFGIGMGSAKCSDINPGAFHVVLANQIALKQESFVADVEARKETWNQPVYGYDFEILGKTTAEGAAQAYIVRAKMMYAEDDPDGEEYKHIFNWNPVVGTVNFMGAVMELDYILELDYAGNIIGGSWLGESKRNHPDLFWKPTKKIEFTPGFSFLYKIYKPFLVE